MGYGSRLHNLGFSRLPTLEENVPWQALGAYINRHARRRRSRALVDY